MNRDLPPRLQGERYVQPGATQKVAFTGVNAQSTAIAHNTLVRLVATANCHVTFGANPVADGNALYLPANVPELFMVLAGTKIGVVQDTAGGNLFVTEATEESASA